MEALTDWLRGIIMVILFASFLELLLPASGIQRFIRLILGLAILLAILQPGLDFVQQRFSAQTVMAMGKALATAEGRTPRAFEEGNRVAEGLFRKELERQVRAVVLSTGGVSEAQVVVETTAGEKGRPPVVVRVRIGIAHGAVDEAGRVRTVRIGREERTAVITEELRNKLVKTVSDLFQLKAEQVEIRSLQ